MRKDSMATSHRLPVVKLSTLIQEHIEIVDETLEKVFSVPDMRRAEIVAWLNKRKRRGFWNATLHDLPLYTAATLAGVEIFYPDFDKYEQLYAELIEGEDKTRAMQGQAGGD